MLCPLHSISSALIVVSQGVNVSHLETTESSAVSWIPTDATHNCMAYSETNLTVTETLLTSVSGLCLCGIRSWKPYVWWFVRRKELLILLQGCWVGRAGAIPWPGRSCEFILLDNVFLDYVTEHSVLDHMRSSDGKTHCNGTWFVTCSLFGLYGA
jgi:hypothetical protein